MSDIAAYNNPGSATVQISAIQEVAPTINGQPTNITVASGSAASFSVTASGTAPFAYRWVKDGVNLPGATNATLSFTNVQPVNIGNYAAVITNAAGSVTSSVVSLTIPGVPAGIWQNLAAYYPFNGNANDASGNGNNGTNMGAANATNRFGVANSAYAFNGTSDYVEIPSSPSLSFGQQITESAWIRPNRLYPPQGSAGWQSMEIACKGFDVEGAADWAFAIDGNRTRPHLFVSGSWVYWDSAESVRSNEWQHVVFTYDGTEMKTYLNGLQTGQQPASGTFRVTAGGMRIGAYAPVNGIPVIGSKAFFSGNLDDIRIYNRALASNEVAQLYASEVPPLPPPPTIGSQPTNQAVLAGRSAGFAVSATDTGTLSYQWFRNGTNALPSATNSTLTIPSAQVTDLGGYSLVVTGGGGSVTSSVAQLYVIRPAVIQPTVVSGFVVGGVIVDGGYGYTNAPVIAFEGGSGSGATGTTVVINGVVVAVNMTSAGSGYGAESPTVLVGSPVPSVAQLALAKAVKPVFYELLPGAGYQLQLSLDLIMWTNSGPPFTATNTNMVYPQYWDVENWSKLYFRLLSFP